MLTLWNQFEDLFADELKVRRSEARTFVPAVDIEELENGYLLTADVPGIAPEDIDVSVEDRVLTLRGERKQEVREEKKNGYRRTERSWGRFQRSFVLPQGVNVDGVEAHVEHGQLYVRIPKPVAALPKKVQVKALHAAPEEVQKTG